MTGKVVDMIFHIHQYIRSKAPECFLLESGKGLTMVTHQDAFAAYLESYGMGWTTRTRSLGECSAQLTLGSHRTAQGFTS